MTNLCDRVPAYKVDFRSARFIVGTSAGLTLSDGKLEMGDEIPPGRLSPEVLRQEYEAPPRRIELDSYAQNDATLREACARRGVVLSSSSGATDKDPAVRPSESGETVTPEFLDRLSLTELVAFCQAHGIPTSGTKQQLRQRIASRLA